MPAPAAQATTTPTPRKVHWLVRMNRRNRSVFYAMLGLSIASHLWFTGASPLLWAVMVFQFFIYPQLAYWRAVRSQHQRAVELQNFNLDAVFGGLWSGFLGMPLWLSFSLIIGNCINMVVFYDLKGLRMLALTTGGGIALAAGGWLAVAGTWPLDPSTHTVTGLFCIASLAVYFVAFAHDGYVRAMNQYRDNETLRLQFEEIQSLQTRLRDLALRDPLTGLFNRRQLDAVLAPELERCRKAGTPLALLMIDIDHFKRINDTHGHAAGDAMLQALAQLLQSHVRPQDLACRHGGEEFVLLLADTPLPVALERAEALREAFQGLRVRYGEASMSATLSCGLAAFPPHAAQPQTLTACADLALYAAKLQGRNRVAVHGAPDAWSARN